MSRLGLLLLVLPVTAGCSLDLLPPETARHEDAVAPKGYRVEHRPGGEWALERVSRDGTVIWIRFAESGCVSFDHAEFAQTSKGLRLIPIARVLVPIRKRYGCLLYLLAARHRIELPRPLGGDEILGECVPGESTPEQRICASMHQAARNPL